MQWEEEGVFLIFEREKERERERYWKKGGEGKGSSVGRGGEGRKEGWVFARETAMVGWFYVCIARRHEGGLLQFLGAIVCLVF